MRKLNKWLFLLIYFVPYSYITIFCIFYSDKIINAKNLIGFILIVGIQLLGFFSIFIPMFILKFYKKKLLGFLFIIFGNLINSCISIISILLFFDYKKYDYYNKPFGTISLSVFLSIVTIIFQLIRYALIILPENTKKDIEKLNKQGDKIVEYWSRSLYLLYLVPIYSEILNVIKNPINFTAYFIILIPFLVIPLYKEREVEKLNGILYIIVGNIVSLLSSNIFLFNIYIYKEFLQIFYMLISFIVLTWLQILVFIKVNKY